MRFSQSPRDRDLRFLALSAIERNTAVLEWSLHCRGEGVSNAGTQYDSLHEQNHRFCHRPALSMVIFPIALAGPSTLLHLPLRYPRG